MTLTFSWFFVTDTNPKHRQSDHGGNLVVHDLRGGFQQDHPTRGGVLPVPQGGVPVVRGTVPAGTGSGSSLHVPGVRGGLGQDVLGSGDDRDVHDQGIRQAPGEGVVRSGEGTLTRYHAPG